MHPTLTIIIVSWNVRELLRRCIMAVDASMAGSGIAYTTVVVDNASADGTPEMLRAEFPAVQLIEAGANLGFSVGNNLALSALFPANAELSAISDYVLLLNPDTEPCGDAIPHLVRTLAARPELAAIGPQLRYGDGSVQSSRRRFPSRMTFFWESTVLDRIWPDNLWAKRYHYADQSDTMAHGVDWLVGAALLVRRVAVARAGLLDERFFMYSEELEWQRRIQESWGNPAQASAIWYDPGAVIVHYEGKSSEQALSGRHLNFHRSRLLLARMWYGWGFAALLHNFYRLSYVYELAVEGAKLLIGHRRALRRQRIGVYLQVLRDM